MVFTFESVKNSLNKLEMYATKSQYEYFLQTFSSSYGSSGKLDPAFEDYLRGKKDGKERDFKYDALLSSFIYFIYEKYILLKEEARLMAIDFGSSYSKYEHINENYNEGMLVATDQRKASLEHFLQYWKECHEENQVPANFETCINVCEREKSNYERHKNTLIKWLDHQDFEQLQKKYKKEHKVVAESESINDFLIFLKDKVIPFESSSDIKDSLNNAVSFMSNLLLKYRPELSTATVEAANNPEQTKSFFPFFQRKKNSDSLPTLDN